MAPPLPTVPRATYRLQLHAGFGFADAQAIVPYLAALGISHLYTSPITKARPGSMHGYDVVDFNRLNPELGGEEDFARLVETLHHHEMGLIVDFVPNHMGVDPGNPWWGDVLEWGEASAYAAFFDIDWEAGARGLHGKILLPVLGDHYGTLLEAGELVLRFAPESGGIFLTYHDHRFPIAVRHYARLLLPAAGRLGERAEPLLGLIDGFTALAAGGDSRARRAQRRREADELKARLKAMAAADPAVEEAIGTALDLLNGTPGTPASFRMLDRLLDDQAYRLAFWRVASSEINYRRFFDINELAALRMELPEVFEATHQMLFRLIAEGAVQGIRLDHIDGLHDPFGYCRRLRRRALDQLGRSGDDQAASKEPPPIYIVVEKILAWHERLRAELPVAGTTGYDFMSMVNGLFVNAAAERSLTLTYGRFINREPDFGEIVADAKLHILRYALDSELHVLAHQLYRLAQQSWSTRDYTLSGLREALAEVIIRFPVYRTYVTAAGAQDEDRRYLDWAIGQARKTSGLIDRSVFDFLHAALSTDLRRDRRYRRAELVATAMRFQQLTSPVMAKAVEDTAFYRYVRLLSLNDVGGEPDHFGVSVGAFHHVMQQQQREHPLGMLATATHDHKRGEDVRARIDALSELPLEWRRRVRRWARLNRFRVKEVDGRPVPGRNDAYLLYQTLVGSWPLGLGADDAEGLAAYAERIAAYLIKASREAKQRTSWTAPDAGYESGLERFVQRILDPQDGRAFLGDLLPFQAQIAIIGALNGLAQTLLKLTAPGVPDTYQGCELWDLSLVDPDNRRPVDFALRRAMLAQDADPADLLSSWQDGRIKQHVVARTLALRRAAPALFTGHYTPLEASGPHVERLVTFARSTDDATLIVIVPRLVAPLLDGAEVPLAPPAAWGDTRIALPDRPVGSLHNPLTGKMLEPGADGLAAAEALADLPVALLTTVLPD
jgi:(1->4)-alpha-D-glucan 1-alpha-D-glucosylmutase